MTPRLQKKTIALLPADHESDVTCSYRRDLPKTVNDGDYILGGTLLDPRTFNGIADLKNGLVLRIKKIEQAAAARP